MILHTIIATDEVMMNQDLTPFECKCINGRMFEGKKTDKGFEISRLISTNPGDYLNKDFSPGSHIV